VGLSIGRILIALTAIAALAVVGGCGFSDGHGERAANAGPNARTQGPPDPNEGIPQQPEPLAERLTATHAALDRAIDRWRAGGGLKEHAPRDVTLYALYEQRIYLLLTPRRDLARAVQKRLDGPVAGEAREILGARRELSSLSTPQPRRRFETGRALAAGKLKRFYERAEHRFGVSWKVLAAVNFVETGFNKLRNKSTAGAQGPMQFIPSTWDAYGMGGDIDDPRDAIMGAANYLNASGAPGDYRQALHAYNPSDAYVDAVLAYARRIRHDRNAFPALHSWQVFVNTRSGIVRLTGPGLGR
jgi:Transglycosylase SLT domain